jgi:hypothetical protein
MSENLRRHYHLGIAGKTQRISIDKEARVVAIGKRAQPSWSDVKASVQSFDRVGLQGLLQDLYALSKENQAFLHARLSLGIDQLKPYKESISRWINPDLMRNQPISVSKSKKAIANYKKAIGRPEGLAELSIFYCEEAFDFLLSCGLDDERYYLALIRMYDQATNFVLSLPTVEWSAYIDRLDKLRLLASHVGWGLQEEFEDIWCAAGFDEHDDQ